MRSISPCCIHDSGTLAGSRDLPTPGISLKPLLLCLGLLTITACSSESDSISLGNGLSTEVAADSTDNTDANTEANTPGFLGTSATAEPFNDGSSGTTTQQSDETQQTTVAVGIGGSTESEPLDDAPTGIAPSVGEANAADDPDSIDLSNDILIPPEAPDLDITAEIGELVFAWNTPDAETLSGEISFDIDLFNTETRELTNVVSDLDATTRGYRLPLVPHLFNWEISEFILSICTPDDCLRSFNTPVSELQSDSINVVQSDNTREFDFFGSSLSTAANGRVLLAGKPGHDANSQDAVVAESDESVFDAGAAELLFTVENEWFSASVLTQDSPSFNSQFGFAVAADSTGDTVVVGAPTDSSEQDLAGAAHVFIRAGETWIQSAILVPGQARAFARFGHSVAISDDGQLIAVGAPGDSNATIDPFASVDSEIDAGSVTLFRFDNASGGWILSDYVRSSVVTSGQRFGESIALNESASTLVVAAPGEVAGELRAMPGIVHIFEILDAGVFRRQQLFQLADSEQDPEFSAFGSAVGISADGSTLVATCLNRPQTEGFTNQLNKPQSEVVVYNLADGTIGSFSEQQRLTPAGEHGFATELSVTLSSGGSKIASGVLNPDSDDNKVTVFRQSGLQGTDSTWNMVNSFEAPQRGTLNFATSLEFSSDGEKLFVGAEQGAEGGRIYVY